MFTQPLPVDDTRAELIEALTHATNEAKRHMSIDNLGRPNERWASCHAYINWLLDLLEG